MDRRHTGGVSHCVYCSREKLHKNTHPASQLSISLMDQNQHPEAKNRFRNLQTESHCCQDRTLRLSLGKPGQGSDSLQWFSKQLSQMLQSPCGYRAEDSGYHESVPVCHVTETLEFQGGETGSY